MEKNPYSAQLAGQSPDPILATTAARLNTLACSLTPEQLEAPHAPGKWSPREILAHLADCELAFSFRLRQILAAPTETPNTIQPFDQTAWSTRYAAYDTPSALALFTAARAWNLNLLTTITPEDRTRPAHHPERGDITFQNVLETIAGHDINHLQQLEALIRP
ncbi:DinB family protein [Granulicella sibirica]|uniref:DinB-like domain-containing protein n=1 Tax=Granulicella sibirica TaxID=2479048 RepID=A0A4Q0STG1_9BACT|nr:DinB family protein [Granulicella sibirica]RXH54255.1 hypothetical protein GRAN_4551 [Granulicella sibirica]